MAVFLMRIHTLILQTGGETRWLSFTCLRHKTNRNRNETDRINWIVMGHVTKVSSIKTAALINGILPCIVRFLESAPEIWLTVPVWWTCLKYWFNICVCDWSKKSCLLEIEAKWFLLTDTWRMCHWLNIASSVNDVNGVNRVYSATDAYSDAFR